MNSSLCLSTSSRSRWFARCLEYTIHLQFESWVWLWSSIVVLISSGFLYHLLTPFALHRISPFTTSPSHVLLPTTPFVSSLQPIQPPHHLSLPSSPAHSHPLNLNLSPFQLVTFSSLLFWPISVKVSLVVKSWNGIEDLIILCFLALSVYSLGHSDSPSQACETKPGGGRVWPGSRSSVRQSYSRDHQPIRRYHPSPFWCSRWGHQGRPAIMRNGRETGRWQWTGCTYRHWVNQSRT